MTNQQIIIIGAGASGLMAAKELAAAGNTVVVLEAAKRAGGRMLTFTPEGFSVPVEAGAEFIHGNLPLTISLAKEARIPLIKIDGEMYRSTNGELKKTEEMIEGWDELVAKMGDEKSDITLSAFLQMHYSDGKYSALCAHVKSFAEGFDLADVEKVSIKSLYEEWSHEEMDEQYRLHGGYKELAIYLQRQCERMGCGFAFQSAVEKVTWKQNEVEVTTRDGQTYNGNKLLFTAPISILQCFDTNASVVFTPAIDDYTQAAKQIGFGTVIKFIIEFKEAFWQKRAADIQFILSDAVVPVWWTQNPDKIPLLTGWMGGKHAYTFSDKTDLALHQLAMHSLAEIFKMEIAELEKNVQAWKVYNWRNKEYIHGAYTYSFPGSEAARELLRTPIDNTIYFAGEALYKGEFPGTVEAALVNGKEMAEKLMKG